MLKLILFYTLLISTSKALHGSHPSTKDALKTTYGVVLPEQKQYRTVSETFLYHENYPTYYRKYAIGLITASIVLTIRTRKGHIEKSPFLLANLLNP